MEVILKIQNGYSWLICSDEKIKTDLWKALRVRELGYQHSRLYKQKIWDGFTDFFKKESGRFLTGLLPEVLGALKFWGVNPKIVDERGAKVQWLYKEIKPDFLHQWWPEGKEKFDLYDYQVDLVNQIIKYDRAIVTPPTGSGKTELMIAALKCLPPNTPTLVLANKTSLVQQNYDRLGEWGFKDFGRLYGKFEEPNVITCATVQSLHKVEKLLPHIKVIFVDEIHEMMSKVPKQCYNKLKNATVRIAVSATWEKFGGKDKSQRYFVKGYFGPVLKTEFGDEKGIVKTKKLQERGILSKSVCTFYVIDEPQIPYDIYLDAVTNGIANNWHFHNIVSRLMTTLKGRTMTLVERISHGDALNSLVKDSLWVAGKDDLNARKYVLNMLSTSNKTDTRALATVGIFNTGINAQAHNLINAAGGQADHIIIQRMGRGLRTSDDKDALHYFDFIFKINPYLEKHSMKRIAILEKEGHEIIIKDKIDF